eukprot:CAMPEP_0206402540 /NCGR_PEP_ID=MMETSP0294-20121207/27054_1 /ASSEMBLY_ACC=CAM_ASM_000327 /TAXON_ID=39354 /ORGANISM="Heterosigma akashiwo, Strain CCMP2393" /LENGTH=50 /DNA_ID=CAMNT_0053859707 /DNA_START=191 /DNA_END=340 /DNA_ORIENTATION=+
MGLHGMPVRPGAPSCSILKKQGGCHKGMACEYDHPFPEGMEPGVLPPLKD